MTHFIRSLTPPNIWARFQTLCDQNPDIRTLLYIMGPDKVLEWIHSIGVVSDRNLSTFVPPLPPAELRTIVAAPEIEIFLWTGLVDLANLMGLYERHKQSAPDVPRVLDFGCGCGRMTRFFCNISEEWKVIGSDINPRLVEWCKENLKGVTTLLNRLHPPLPLVDASLDLAYSLSIFTHLNEEFATAWLRDLGRVLAPNGILIVTTHGYPALDVIEPSKVHHGMFQMTAERVREVITNFARQPFIFQKYTANVIEVAKAGEDYGNAFIHPDYILRSWNNDQFCVLEHIPGGLRGWQDITVLQRRA